jgi:energy-coupling factor transporter ATP-binding protein EcfA2
MDEKVSISSPGGAIVRSIASPAELVFDNVQFHYAPDAPVLRGISFGVAPGEKVAIVEPTGSGKTTLISLVTRLYAVREGRILLDSVDIRSLPQGAGERHGAGAGRELTRGGDAQGRGAGGAEVSVYVRLRGGCDRASRGAGWLTARLPK